MNQNPSPDIVIVNGGNNDHLLIDHSKYPNSVVFARRRRLREGFWKKVLAGIDPSQPLNYLEVGCQEGSSVLWFFENFLSHPQSRVTVADVFQEGVRETFDHNMRVSGYTERVNVLHGNSGEGLRKLPLYSFDIIYVDGIHASFGVIEDAILTWRLLKNGGIMIFDDYDFSGWPSPLNRPKSAIDFFLWAYAGKYELLGKHALVGLKKTYPDGAQDAYLPEPT